MCWMVTTLDAPFKHTLHHHIKLLTKIIGNCLSWVHIGLISVHFKRYHIFVGTVKSNRKADEMCWSSVDVIGLPNELTPYSYSHNAQTQTCMYHTAIKSHAVSDSQCCYHLFYWITIVLRRRFDDGLNQYDSTEKDGHTQLIVRGAVHPADFPYPTLSFGMPLIVLWVSHSLSKRSTQSRRRTYL